MYHMKMLPAYSIAMLLHLYVLVSLIPAAISHSCIFSNKTLLHACEPQQPQDQLAPVYRTPVVGSAWSLPDRRGLIVSRDERCECFDPDSKSVVLKDLSL